MTAHNAIDAVANGGGLYSIQEAALYSGLHPTTIRSWFFHKEKPVFRRSSMDFEDNPHLLTFTDFVEALYVKELRDRFNISFPVIRTAIETARDLEQIANPFAHPNFRTAVVGKSIYLYQVNKPDLMTGLTHERGQVSSKVILQDFIESLEFDDEDIAKLYVAYQVPGERIVAARDYNLGIPMMESSLYTAETLWNAVASEGGVQEAALAYDVKESTVQVAMDYLKILKRAA